MHKTATQGSQNPWINQFIEMLFPLDASSLNIEGAYTLKYQHLPHSLFKYRSVDKNSLKNLHDDTVWLADPRTFNDPYDCGPYIDNQDFGITSLKKDAEKLFDFANVPIEKRSELLRKIDESSDEFDFLSNMILASRDFSAEEIEKFEKAKPVIKDLLTNLREDTMKSFADQFKNSVKLCSFSERVDSTLMWAHYASYHQGFCIEYDIKSIPPDELTSRFMYPVIYSNQPFNATPFMLQPVDSSNRNNLYLNLATLIKASDWSYEKEWRLVLGHGILGKAQAWKIPKPRCVYLGSEISTDNQKLLIEICKFKEISIKKMKHSRSAFEMEAFPIS